MRTKSLVIGLACFVVVGLILSISGKSQKQEKASQIGEVGSSETATQETYVSEVIISAPWGEKNLVYDKEESPPGEFGYHVDEETSIGPSCLAVAPNGDIYIADPLNNRMQRFNSAGGFICTIPMPRTIADICIDQENNIYLYGGGDVSGGGILKYDQEGNLLNSYPLFSGFSRTGNFIHCDILGRIFLAYPWSGDRSGFYQVGTSEEAFSQARQQNSARDGLLGFNSASLGKNLYFQPAVTLLKFGHGILYQLSFEEDTIKTSGSMWGWFFGCDDEDKIYMYLWDSENSKAGIRKYDSNGVLLTTFAYGCNRPFLKAEGFGGSRSMTLDDEGNLYMLCYSMDDGIQVTKWYKQE
jgi:hypothetical protein